MKLGFLFLVNSNTPEPYRHIRSQDAFPLCVSVGTNFYLLVALVELGLESVISEAVSSWKLIVSWLIQSIESKKRQEKIQGDEAFELRASHGFFLLPPDRRQEQRRIAVGSVGHRVLRVGPRRTADKYCTRTRNGFPPKFQVEFIMR